jgi:ectoine hydroxylase-related dioxygenase (phytanoyl-CoA dioxygenase family)
MPETATPAVLQPTVTLTADQVAFYHTNGYLVVDQISTPSEIAMLRGVYDRLFEQRAGRNEGAQFDLGGTDEEGKAAVLPQILGPSRFAPEMKTGLFRVNAEAIAKQLLGGVMTAQGDHAILKPAKYGAPTPWHQDEAYWGADMNYNAFSLWMPLQDTNIEMGCMWFVPGSHKMEIQPHHSINHDPRIHGLEMDQPPRMQDAVACPLVAGGCTIHHNRTMHYAGPNGSDTPRRAYIIGFGTPPTKRATPRDFYWEKAKQTARSQRAENAAKQTAAAAK